MGYIAYPCKYKILKRKIIIILYNRKENIVGKAKIDKKDFGEFALINFKYTERNRK